jgi:hypothetical protein
VEGARLSATLRELTWREDRTAAVLQTAAGTVELLQLGHFQVKVSLGGRGGGGGHWCAGEWRNNGGEPRRGRARSPELV